MPTCRMLFRHLTCLADSRADWTAGRMSAISSPIMAIAVNNSMIVNALRRIGFVIAVSPHNQVCRAEQFGVIPQNQAHVKPVVHPQSEGKHQAEHRTIGGMSFHRSAMTTDMLATNIQRISDRVILKTMSHPDDAKFPAQIVTVPAQILDFKPNIRISRPPCSDDVECTFCRRAKYLPVKYFPRITDQP